MLMKWRKLKNNGENNSGIQTEQSVIGELVYKGHGRKKIHIHD